MSHALASRPRTRSAAALAAVTLAVTLAACARRDVPGQLAGYRQTLVAHGEVAMRQVQRLHGSPLELRDAAFAVYGSGAASVWMAEARDTARAMRFVADMRERIDRGGTPFHVDSTETRDGREVLVVSGLGQRHACFRAGRRIVWIAAQRRVAAAAREQAIAFYR